MDYDQIRYKKITVADILKSTSNESRSKKNAPNPAPDFGLRAIV